MENPVSKMFCTQPHDGLIIVGVFKSKHVQYPPAIGYKTAQNEKIEIRQVVALPIEDGTIHSQMLVGIDD